MDGEIYHHKQGRKGSRKPNTRPSLPGVKGLIPSDTVQKGRDASGASSGAEALIAAPTLLNYECFRHSDLSAKGAPL